MLDWSAHQLRNRSKINRMMLIQWIADAHQSRCIEPHEWFRIKFDKFHNKVGVKKYCEWSEVQVKCNLSKTIKWDDTSCINFIAINFPNKQSVRHSESEFQIESNDFFCAVMYRFHHRCLMMMWKSQQKRKTQFELCKFCECKCIHFETTKHLSYVCRTKCSAFSIDRYLCVMSLFPYIDLLGSFTRDLERTKLPLCYIAIIFFSPLFFSLSIGWRVIFLPINWLAGQKF